MAHDKVSQEFGSLLFTDADMQERLPRPTYKKLRSVIQDGKPLDLDIANEVAHAVLDDTTKFLVRWPWQAFLHVCVGKEK